MREILKRWRLIVLGALVTPCIGCGTAEMAPAGNSVELHMPQFRGHAITIREVTSESIPPLAEFISRSDYIILASQIDKRFVSKREKSSSDPRAIDFSDWPGALDIYSVSEQLLSRKELASGPGVKDDLRTFDIYREIGNVPLVAKPNTRYLFFIERVPIDDSIFATLDLDPSKALFRPYIGEQSLVSGNPDPMHGGWRIGRLPADKPELASVVSAVRDICAALSDRDPAGRKQRLAGLATSKETALSETARYFYGKQP